MGNRIFHESTEKEILLFHKHIEEFGPVKNLICFQYNANFIFSLFPEVDNLIHLVLENFKKEFMLFSSFNCGYYGEGPRGTFHVLKHLGISDQDAEQCFSHSAVSVSFSEGGKYSYFFPNVFFGYSIENNFRLNDFCNVSVSNRRIIIVNPQVSNAAGLFSLFHIMEPTSLEFLMGKPSSYFCNDTRTEDLIRYNSVLIRSVPPYVEGVNLIIYGELFDVWCLVDRRTIASLINAISMYIAGKPFLPETHIGAFVISCKNSKTNKILQLLEFIFNRKMRDKQILVSFPKRRIETWKLL